MDNDSATTRESHVSFGSRRHLCLDRSPWAMGGCRSREISSKRIVLIASLGSANTVQVSREYKYGIAPHSTPNSLEREKKRA